MKIDNRKDYLLLLLYSPGVQQGVNEPIAGRTRLVKMLFLFKEEVLKRFRKADIEPELFYEFFPWNFGPFSKQVYDDLKFFQLRGFIAVSEKEAETSPESVAEWEYLGELERSGDLSYTEYVEQEFFLTEKGRTFSEKLYGTLNTSQRALLRDFKAKVVNVPLRALLKYVYTQYPESTTSSKIKDDVLGE